LAKSLAKSWQGNSGRGSGGRGGRRGGGRRRRRTRRRRRRMRRTALIKSNYPHRRWGIKLWQVYLTPRLSTCNVVILAKYITGMIIQVTVIQRLVETCSG